MAEGVHLTLNTLDSPSLDTKLSQFTVGKLSGVVENSEDPRLPTKSLVITITLKRNFTYHIGTTYFPTICLLLVACLTLQIEPGHFEATIALSLTNMLVMQTLQASSTI